MLLLQRELLFEAVGVALLLPRWLPHVLVGTCTPTAPRRPLPNRKIGQSRRRNHACMLALSGREYPPSPGQFPRKPPNGWCLSFFSSRPEPFLAGGCEGNALRRRVGHVTIEHELPYVRAHESERFLRTEPVREGVVQENEELAGQGHPR